MKYLGKIKVFIKSHKQLYKRIRPIELKYYAFQDFRHRIAGGVRMIVPFIIKPRIRRITGRKETRDLLKLRNIHQGKRIFVIANGPSIQVSDLLKLKNEITISVNGAVTLADTIGWKSTYYLFGDLGSWLGYEDKINNTKYEGIFLSLQCAARKYESEFLFKPYYIDLYWRFKDIVTYYLLGKNIKEMEFSDDIYLKGAYAAGRSGVTVAVQLAVYMGAREIYLLGQDCDFKGPARHFYDEPDDSIVPNARDVERWQERWQPCIFAFYRAARLYCEQHQIKLYNATRGGCLEELERVDFDKIIGNS